MDRAIIVALLGAALAGCDPASGSWKGDALHRAVHDTAGLQAPGDTMDLTLTQALRSRRSVREFAARRLSDLEISRLAWAAQGITHPDGRRTAPSAGALYPLELYLATSEGFFHYDARGNRLTSLHGTDLRPALERAAHGQAPVGTAPAVFVIAAVYGRTAAKYGTERAARYVHMEAGHAAQNLLLMAGALGLGAVPVGAFNDAALGRALHLPSGEAPLYLVPVGEPRR
ncbi:MAG TPA: SagB/ThcOx family dehydrogenase [Gemmatimonadales bacterium]